MKYPYTVINLYNIFKECIIEGIQYDNEEYSIDYENDLVNDLIRFSDKISFKKDEYGVNIDPKLISFITDKIISNLTEYINLDDYDYIISPKSSSILTKNLINKLSSLSNKPTFISDLFLKNDVENIWLDIEAAEKELDPKHVKMLVKSFERSKKFEGEPIKLQRLGKYHRKYVRNLLKVNPEYDNILISMLDKNILVIDDIITSGKTLDDIRVMLSKLGTGKITLFTMFG